MFSYNRLSPDGSEIRLVRLIEVSDPNARISLELCHASMDDDITYAALSYVWGDVNNPAEITVNGSSFTIGRNLHAALIQLWENHVRCWLWIDSLCIHQSDLEEKNHQVDQMRTIFSLAQCVYAWLGLGSKKTDKGMDLVSRIGPRALAVGAYNMQIEMKEVYDYLQKEPSSSEAGRNDNIEGSELAWFIFDLLHKPDLQNQTPHEEESLAAGIQSLMQRDYWYRIWINQELAVAKEVIMMCGTRSVLLDLLEATFTAVDVCNRYYCFCSSKTRDFAMGLHANFYKNLPLDSRRLHRRGYPLPLSQLLATSSYTLPPGRPLYAASDPRDIVFGLLGIITDKDALGLRADYKRTTAEVYTAVTRELVYAGGEHWQYHLDWCVPKERNLHGLPTWVPDWQEVGRSGFKTRRINGAGVFNATIGGPKPLRIQHKNTSDDTLGILRHLGCQVDVITEVKKPAEWEQHDDIAKSSLAYNEAQLSSILNFAQLGPESSPGENYVWRTILSRSWYDRLNLSTSEDISLLVRRFMRLARNDVDLLTPGQIEFIRELVNVQTFREPLKPKSLEAQLGYVSRQFQLHGLYLDRQRTLFKTFKGMFGLGHMAIQPGDAVTLLWGVPTPIILRPRNSDGVGFTFVGDAYVDGIMEGEFLETLPAEEEFAIY